MAETIFYTQVAGGVAGALGSRKSTYSALVRNNDQHAWLNKKMAYCNASANNTVNGRNAKVGTPTGGGISGEGLYQPGSSSAGKYMPKPHITSVKISSDGDFGSILKCDVAFTVYNLADLNAHQAFFDLGADISVNYGWNQAGAGAGSAGNFKGRIYNFSYQVTSVGAFDCISYGMSAGMAMISGTPNAAGQSAGTVTDASGNEKAADSLSGVLSWVIEKVGEPLVHNQITADGYRLGCLEFPTTPAASETTTETKGDASKDSKHYYIALQSLVYLLVQRIKLSVGKSFDDFNILCDPDVTKVNPCTDPTKLVSGNFTEVAFPGFGVYDATHDFGFAGTPEASSLASGDASKIMLNIDWVQKTINEMGKDKHDGQKSAIKTTSKLLGMLFDSIHINSGTRWKLSLVENPKNPKEYYIQDVNFIDSKISPFEITAVTNNSICRSISLQSKIPSAMATAAFIGNSSTYAPNGQPVKAVNDKETEKADSGDAVANLTSAKAAMVAKAPAAPVEGSKAEVGPTNANVTTLQAALARIFTEPSLSATSGLSAIPIPIDFSCTLDGINGFVFGNAVTTNYLPLAYKKSKIAFTVTTVTHQISGNDWTTTLNTIMRSLE